MTRRDPLAARDAQPVALASEGKPTTLLEYTQIRVNGGTQMRAALNEETASEYADALRGGATLPPVVVFHDGSDYWLGDGFHRVRAHFMAHGHTARIPAEVRSGTRRDAVLCAAGANADHGLRRTADDKRRAVETLLRDEEWQGWSDREIARRCHVSHPFVSKVRGEIEPAHTGNVTSMETERTFVHPKTGEPTTMRTANIGATKPAPPAATPSVVGKCRVCGRGLTDPASVGDACGPTCAAKLAAQSAAGDDPAWVDTRPNPADVANALVESDADGKPAAPPDLAAAGWALRTMTRATGAVGWWMHNAGGNKATNIVGSPGEAVRLAYDQQIDLANPVAVVEEIYNTRSTRIEQALSFWSIALGRLEDIGELTGRHTLALPARRAIEDVIAAYKENVAE